MYSVIDIGLQLKENSPFPDDISKCNNLIFILRYTCYPPFDLLIFNIKIELERCQLKKC